MQTFYLHVLYINPDYCKMVKVEWLTTFQSPLKTCSVRFKQAEVICTRNLQNELIIMVWIFACLYNIGVHSNLFAGCDPWQGMKPLFTANKSAWYISYQLLSSLSIFIFKIMEAKIRLSNYTMGLRKICKS